MNCEICNKSPAKVAITVKEGGDERELYVCDDCARRERIKREKKRERTRRSPGESPSVSMTVIGGPSGMTPPPQILNALASVFSDFADEIEKFKKSLDDGTIADAEANDVDNDKSHDAEAQAQETPHEPVPAEKKTPTPLNLKSMRIERAYVVRSRLHLGGLYLIGELDAVLEAADALGVVLAGEYSMDVKHPGHLFSVSHWDNEALAKRFVADLVRQERNARVRLMHDIPRVFGDSICRALAMLKNCRLLSASEYLDLLASMRLAALYHLLDGIDLRSITKMMERIELDPGTEEGVSQEDRDLDDGARADEVNELFEDVVLNEKADDLTDLRG